MLEFAARYVAEDPDAIETVAPAKSTERGAIDGLAALGDGRSRPALERLREIGDPRWSRELKRALEALP